MMMIVIKENTAKKFCVFYKLFQLHEKFKMRCEFLCVGECVYVSYTHTITIKNLFKYFVCEKKKEYYPCYPIPNDKTASKYNDDDDDEDNNDERISLPKVLVYLKCPLK